MWDALVVRLRAAGILDEVDGPALTNLVLSYHFTVYAAELLVRDGMVEEDKAHAGRLRKHPAFQMWRDSQAAFGKWASHFEVTPASREGPLVGAEGELSELEKLLRGANATKKGRARWRWPGKFNPPEEKYGELEDDEDGAR